jgi:DNA-directed RNA polymerase subunit omega
VIYPAWDELSAHVDSKYTLVVAAAKRARQLMEENEGMFDEGATNPVTVALEEIKKGLVKYERTKFGIK